MRTEYLIKRPIHPPGKNLWQSYSLQEQSTSFWRILYLLFDATGSTSFNSITAPTKLHYRAARTCRHLVCIHGTSAKIALRLPRTTDVPELSDRYTSVVLHFQCNQDRLQIRPEHVSTAITEKGGRFPLVVGCGTTPQTWRSWERNPVLCAPFS